MPHARLRPCHEWAAQDAKGSVAPTALVVAMECTQPFWTGLTFGGRPSGASVSLAAKALFSHAPLKEAPSEDAGTSLESRKKNFLPLQNRPESAYIYVCPPITLCGCKSFAGRLRGVCSNAGPAERLSGQIIRGNPWPDSGLPRISRPFSSATFTTLEAKYTHNFKRRLKQRT